MKRFLSVLILIYISECSMAQVVNTNGAVTNTASEYVNKNGAIGISGVTKNGAPWNPTGGNANALDFTGLNNYVSLPPAVYFDGDFTIECWVYPRSFQNWSRIIDFGNGSGGHNVLLSYTYETSGVPGFYVEGEQFAANQSLPLNQWSHIAATLSGNDATIYINGVAAGYGTVPIPANVIRNDCFIGKSNWGAGDPNADAMFDELRIWNTAKSASEIQTSMFQELTGNEQGLVAYYNFNAGTAGGDNTSITTLTDLSPNGHDGTLVDFGLQGNTSNWVKADHQYGDGTTPENASRSAYAIKQAFPDSPDGYYWIKNPAINGGQPFRIYADMTFAGGGWTLILCNAQNDRWTYSNAISRNVSNPSITSNYSIVGWADYIKRSSSGFQYMIDAETKGSNGGIWTANGNYSFVRGDNSQTNVTLNDRFGSWSYNNRGIEQRMPWYSDCTAFLTTSTSCYDEWWGTLVTKGGWAPAPWIAAGCGYEGCKQSPGIIWYWVR